MDYGDAISEASITPTLDNITEASEKTQNKTVCIFLTKIPWQTGKKLMKDTEIFEILQSS